MAVVHGVITGVQLLTGSPAGVGGYKGYLITCDFGVYDSSADTMDIPDVAATIKAHVRNGKNMAMVAGAVPVRAFGGRDTNGNAVYAGTLVISSDTLTGNLTDAAQTEPVGDFTASTGVGVFVPILES